MSHSEAPSSPEYPVEIEWMDPLRSIEDFTLSWRTQLGEVRQNIPSRFAERKEQVLAVQQNLLEWPGVIRAAVDDAVEHQYRQEGVRHRGIGYGTAHTIKLTRQRHLNTNYLGHVIEADKPAYHIQELFNETAVRAKRRGMPRSVLYQGSEIARRALATLDWRIGNFVINDVRRRGCAFFEDQSKASAQEPGKVGLAAFLLRGIVDDAAEKLDGTDKSPGCIAILDIYNDNPTDQFDFWLNLIAGNFKKKHHVNRKHIENYCASYGLAGMQGEDYNRQRLAGIMQTPIDISPVREVAIAESVAILTQNIPQ